MFRRSFVTIFVSAAIGLLSATASAATITGSTGLINIPNADALRPSTMELSAHMVDGAGVLALNVGVIPQVEVGVYSFTRGNDVGLALKGVLSPETQQAPGIAAGLERESMYLVFSRSFNKVRGHVGVGNGRYNGPFFGLSMMLNGASVSSKGGISPVTTLMIEHDGYGVNAGARIALTPQMKVDVAFLNMEEAMLGISFGVSM